MKRIVFISAFIGVLIVFGCKPHVSPVVISCVGDSITYGHGIKKVEDTYPLQLDRMLGDKYVVKNYGRSGATLLKQGDLPYWNQVAYRNSLLSNPNIVFIMLGTNDTKTQNWKFRKDYKKDYKALISKMKNLKTKPEIWIALPPPAFEVKWGIRDSIIRNDLIPLIKEIAAEEKVKLIDLNLPFIENDNMFPDRIHPNEAGTKKIAEILAKEILSRN